MDSLNTKRKITLEVLFNMSILMAMIGLFLPFNLSSFTIIILIFIWLIKDGLSKKLNYLQQNKKYFFILTLYVLYIIGMLYTSNTKKGFTILEKNLTILILPLIFATSKPLNITRQYSILLIFALANYLLAAFLLGFACYNFFQDQDAQVFYYDKLTAIINFHPIYFAMYLLFSMMIILYGVYKKILRISKLLLLGLISFTFILLIFLSSKMILAISLVLIIGFIVKTIQDKRLKWLASIGSLLFVTIAILSFSGTTKRISEIVNSKWDLISKDSYKYNDAFTGSTLRIITWKLAIKHLFTEQNPIIGVGPGDSQDFLDGVYAKYGMDQAGYLGFNHHNQFVEILVKLGLIGLVIYCYWVFGFFKKAYQSKSWLYLGFLLLFFSMSFTESNLEVHRGIVFFALFNSMFFFSEK